MELPLELARALAGAEARIAATEARIDELKPLEIELAHERVAVTLDLANAAVQIAKDAQIENATLRNALVDMAMEHNAVRAPKSQSQRCGSGEDPLGRQHKLGEHPVEADVRKGDASRLHDKEWVTMKTAASYLGITIRAVQIAAKKGRLTVKGVTPNRRISTESLLEYLPPEKNCETARNGAKRRETSYIDAPI